VSANINRRSAAVSERLGGIRTLTKVALRFVAEVA
jgi:hypothetical protein